MNSSLELMFIKMKVRFCSAHDNKDT